MKIAAHFGEGIDVQLLADLQNEARQERRCDRQAHGLGDRGSERHRVPRRTNRSAHCEVDLSRIPAQRSAHLARRRRPAVGVRQVLRQLADLEALGWYHTDLRTWNVVWDAARGIARLIDHGALAQQPTDAAWPRTRTTPLSYSPRAVDRNRRSARPRNATCDCCGDFALATARRMAPNDAFSRPANRDVLSGRLGAVGRDVPEQEIVPEFHLALEWLLATGTMLHQEHADQLFEISSLGRSLALLEAAQQPDPCWIRGADD